MIEVHDGLRTLRLRVLRGFKFDLNQTTENTERTEAMRSLRTLYSSMQANQ